MLKLSYSSAVAAAAADDVSLSLDYGKLYRRLEEDVRNMDSHAVGKGGSVSGARPGWERMVSIDGTQRDSLTGTKEPGQDVRLTAGIVAGCALGLLDETAAGVRRMAHAHQDVRRNSASTSASAPASSSATQAQIRAAVASNTEPPIDSDYGQCEVWLHLPKALLRADEGLKYRSVTVWGYRSGDQADGVGVGVGGDEAVVRDTGRCPVVLEEEFRIHGIRCYCILGVNSHERVEKQAVIISLEFKGPGQLEWGSTVVDTYQEMTRVVAEVSLLSFFLSLLYIRKFAYALQQVESTSFQTVEALATFVARIVTVDFANERVTVLVEKPSAMAFVGRSGVEITRSQAFFQ